MQPSEVLAFYRDLTEQAGYELETAGVLKSGRKFWALASTGRETLIKGNDLVKGYLLLATSCDGTLATTATPTTVRVVCHNTLAVALNGSAGAVKVPHSTRFDAADVKQRLGIAVSQWDSFMYQMKMLSERKVKNHEAMHYFMRVLCDTDKTGRGQMLPTADNDDDTAPMYWGKVLEPIVAEHYTKRTGRKVRRVNAVLQHPNEPWMLANLDCEVVGSDDVQILECKTAGINGAKLWQDGVPEYVRIQVMHQLAVTGKRTADVAVLIGGQDLQIYRIERDEAMIAALIELERQFWHHVQNDIAPPADGSRSAEAALRILFPDNTGEQKDFSCDADLNNVFNRLVQVRQTLKSCEKEEAVLKQRIQQEMGEAGKALFLAGSVSWKRSKDGWMLDTAKLIAEQPEMAARYQTVKQGVRRFLLNVAQH